MFSLFLLTIARCNGMTGQFDIRSSRLDSPNFTGYESTLHLNPAWGIRKQPSYFLSFCQGVFVDTDGSLVGSRACSTLGGRWCSSEGPGAAVLGLNGLLREGECDLSHAIVSQASNFKGAVCAPGLVHRRAMLNKHGPFKLLRFDRLNLTAWDGDTRFMDSVPFSKYNDQGCARQKSSFWTAWVLLVHFKVCFSDLA